MPTGELEIFEYDERNPDKYADLLSAAWAVLYSLHRASACDDLPIAVDMWARRWPEDVHRSTSPETRGLMEALRRLEDESAWQPPTP